MIRLQYPSLPMPTATPRTIHVNHVNDHAPDHGVAPDDVCCTAIVVACCLLAVLLIAGRALYLALT